MMRSARALIPIAVTFALIASAKTAAAQPPAGVAMQMFDAGRLANLWLEMSGGPFAVPQADYVIRTDAGAASALAAIPRLGPHGKSTGFYMFGDDSFNVVPRRVGYWGWGPVLSISF